MTCFKSKLNQLKSKYFKMASANKKKGDYENFSNSNSKV